MSTDVLMLVLKSTVTPVTCEFDYDSDGLDVISR